MHTILQSYSLTRVVVLLSLAQTVDPMPVYLHLSPLVYSEVSAANRYWAQRLFLLFLNQFENLINLLCYNCCCCCCCCLPYSLLTRQCSHFRGSYFVGLGSNRAILQLSSGLGGKFWERKNGEGPPSYLLTPGPQFGSTVPHLLLLKHKPYHVQQKLDSKRNSGRIGRQDGRNEDLRTQGG